MTLTYLHNLMEDGSKLLEAELPDSSSTTGTPFYREIRDCLEFLTKSIVELRGHLSNMPLDATGKTDSADGNKMSFACIKAGEEDIGTERWIKMTDEVLVYK